MKISELEKDLKKAKKEFGDVEVYVCVGKELSDEAYPITSMSFLQDEVTSLFQDESKTNIIGICLDSILDENE